MIQTIAKLMIILLITYFIATGSAHAAQTFAVIGDYGDGSAAEASVAALVNGWNPDIIITTGDNNYGTLSGSGQQWSAYVGAYFGQYILGDTSGGGNRYAEQTSGTQRFFPTLSNHDTDGTSGSAAGYIDYFHTETSGPGRLPTGTGSHSSATSYYDFVVGDAHFWAVDSDHVDATNLAAQKAWLETGLGNSTSAFNVVYFHHPAYSSSSSHGNTPVMQWDFQDWGADVVFAGHDHVYERIILTDANHDAFPYITVGNGGRSLYGFGTPVAGSLVRYNSDYGALLVTIDGDDMLFEAYSIASGGTLIDSYTTSVPEPASMMLMLTGACLLWRRRRDEGGRS